MKGENVYRIGILLAPKENTEYNEIIEVSIENESIKLPVFNDGAIQVRDRLKYHEIETKDTDYACASSFWLPEKKSQFRKGTEILLEKYSNLGIKWKDKKNIIILCSEQLS